MADQMFNQRSRTEERLRRITPICLGRLAYLSALFVLMLAGSTNTAWGNTPSPSTEAEGLDHVLNQESVPALTNSQTAEELPHKDLERPEVIALLEGVFEPVLQAAAGPFDALAVEEFLSRHAAVVDGSTSLADESGVVAGGPLPSDPGSMLVESSFPLRQNGEVIDLSLVKDGETLGPENPLVEVSVPDELGDGIQLPESDVTVQLPGGAAERSPSIVDGTAVYPNIAADSDFVVAPTPTGVETLTLLRSPDAPRSQTFQLEFPGDAELKLDGEGAVLSAGEEVLLRIPQATAMDAAGESVPVNLSVGTSSLTVTAMPDGDAQWPLLVDPLFESYQWEGTSLWACNEFQSTAWPLEYPSLYMTGCGNRMGSYTQRGIGTRGTAGTYWPSWKKTAHSVPRLKQDELSGLKPTSFLSAMSLTNVYVITSGGPASPYALAGIWDNALEDWSGAAPYKAVWGYPGNGAPLSNGTLTFTSGGSHEAKTGVVSSLAVNEASPATTGEREMFIGGATFEVGDVDPPQVLFPSGTGWVNSVAKDPVTATVKDTGLGAKRATFKIPGQDNVTVQHSCVGTVASPCPRTWTATLMPSQYDPAVMPQGETSIPITGEDVLGQKSPAGVKAQVLIDHTAPDLFLSGNLTEQATAGTQLPEYTLNYNASDGDDAPASALGPFSSKGTGAGQLERPQGIAVDPEGNIWVADSVNHRVLKFGPSGTLLKQVGSLGSGNGQFNDPRGIAVSASGSVWVADAGNKRLQQLNSKGEWIRNVTHAGFSAMLWGVATAPGGAVWVVDREARKAFKFRESDGAFLDEAGEKMPNRPTHPIGIATDSFGNLWMVDHDGHRVMEFDSSGNYLMQFGSRGTANGQFNKPIDIDVSRSGNLLVTDRENHRVQVFETDGTYLRQFGTKGSASNQLNEPLGLAIAPGGLAYVADASNGRIARWEHADQDPQSGVAKVEIKVDGSTVATKAPGCATKNCAVTGSWVLDADNYSVGAHKVEVIATDAVGIQTPRTIDVETHGDRTDPVIALSGTMTQQASLGTTRPSYKLKVDATDPGPSGERKSGAASTTIKVDGVLVDSASPGCPAGACSITREWTLNPNSYSAGPHVVEVKATDAAGRSSTKTLTINIARDTTAPEFANLDPFYTAPSGWVTQRTYRIQSFVTDTNGYGVTSVQLKVDGAVVLSTTQTCAAGGCSKLFGSEPPIDMTQYSGGAHAAELIATDGAGNARKRTWTINVAPVGQIPADEAADTLEAMEETVQSEKAFLPIASTPEFLEPAIIEAGSNPHLKQEGQEIVSSGTTVDTILRPDSGVLTVEGTEGILELIPEFPSGEPEIEEGSAVVVPGSNADTIIRPEYNGAYMFTTIRSPVAPETYEWGLKLLSNQHLVQANPQQIEVRWSNGVTAFLITTEPAHDATGKAVPTTISIAGLSSIVFNIPHRNLGFTYPVAGGQSYETGYAQVTVYFPEEEHEALEEEVEEPLTTEEAQDLNNDVAFMNAFKGTTKHRDRNKPFTKKQAKRLARVKKNGKTVAAPSASASSSPGYPSSPKTRTFELDGRVCSNWDCDIWQVEFNEGVFVRGPDWASVAAYSMADDWACDHHVDDWYTWNLDLDMDDDGIEGSLVRKGDGEHLTYWCEFNAQIYPVPVELALDKDQRLLLEVYPNGYQASRGIQTSTWSFIPFDLP